MTLSELETLYESLTPSTGTDFIKAIHAASSDPSVDAVLLRAFLDKIGTAFYPEGRHLCAESRVISSEERERLILHGRILAAEILLLHKARCSGEVRSKMLRLLEYGSALVRTKYNFLTTALDVVSYPLVEPGFDWQLIEDATSLDIISYRLMEDAVFKKDVPPDGFTFTGKGRGYLRGGILTVCSSDADESASRAFSVCSDRVEVLTRNIRDERLKASGQYDIEALARFSDTFCKTQSAYKKPIKKRAFLEGDIVTIQLTGMSEEGDKVFAKVVDEEAKIAGEVNQEELIKGVTTQDIQDYFFEDECIAGAVLHRDEDGWFFSIRDAYINYARARAEKDHRNDVAVEARAIRVLPERNRIVWITAGGYCGMSFLDESPDTKEGDIDIMLVRNIQPLGKDVFINLIQPKYGYSSVQKFPEDDYILQGFLKEKPDIPEKRPEKTSETPRSKEILRVLSSILYTTAKRGSSIDAYRHLLTSLFLSTLVGDGAAVKAVREELWVLHRYMQFAENGSLTGEIPEGLPEDEVKILRLLYTWKELKETDLQEMGGAASTVLGEIHTLMLGLQISSRYQDEITASRDLVRRRICSLLRVEDSFEAEKDELTGKYGSAEHHEVEFKSSYVFRNDNGQADIDYQGRGQVFEAVCAFLNADGGTLYLGVNNNGDPIKDEDSGIQADFKWFKTHYLQLNKLRKKQLGHPVPLPDSLDHYALFLDCEKKLYFKESLHSNIIIEVTDDADAIRIRVKPAEYEIAYLYPDNQRTGGKAFVREGGSSIEMSRVKKEQRLMTLKRINKEVSFVVTIQEAIEQHRKLIFKDYASGNSGTVKDRYVVPVNLFYNDENVYCYDLQKHEYKQFRLHRIGSIETEMDNPVYTLPLIEPQEADVFRWLPEERNFHIRLRMQVAAKNYLLEEYSKAKDLPENELYEESPDIWILDTRVNGLGAVRRFYVGLADRIEILDTEDSEELKESIRSFLQGNIPFLDDESEDQQEIVEK